jgi:hypothetical protein
MAHINLHRRRDYVRRNIPNTEALEKTERKRVIEIAKMWGCSEGAIRQDVKYIESGGRIGSQKDFTPRPKTHVPNSARKKFRCVQEQKCIYCGDTDGPFELDHIFPSSRGGRDIEEILALSCQKCNRQKNDRTIDEWLGKEKKGVARGWLGRGRR